MKCTVVTKNDADYYQGLWKMYDTLSYHHVIFDETRWKKSVIEQFSMCKRFSMSDQDNTESTIWKKKQKTNCAIVHGDLTLKNAAHSKVCFTVLSFK